MQATREDLNRCTVLFTVTCDPEELEDGFRKALKKAQKDFRAPGFRPGHAPLSLVEQAVDPERLNQAAAEELAGKAVRQLLTENDLKPVQPPAVTFTKFDRAKKECEFRVKVPLPAIVELGDYRSIEVEKPSVEVTDEEVEQQIEELRRRTSKREAVTDRGVEEGDITVVNIRPLDQEGEGRNFMTVAGQTFPSLDEALLGMRVEDIKIVDLSFPEGFQEPDLAGKTLKCQIVLRSLNAVTLPEVDQEFVQKVSEKYASLKAEDVEGLKQRLRERIREVKEEMAQEIVNERIQDELLRICKVEVAENLWEQVAQRRLAELKEEVEARGSTIEDYARQSGMTLEELVKKWTDEAKMYVHRSQLLQSIFQKEQLKLTNAELSEELLLLAEELKVPPAELVKLVNRNLELQQQINIRAIYKKVLRFLNGVVKIKEASSASQA